MTLQSVLVEAGRTKNAVIADAFVKTDAMLSKSENPACSVSGGADSDIVVDMLTKLDPEKRVKYVWFNTGLEYQATKDHLKELEAKYGIEITRCQAIKSIPTCCREFGQPFISKMVSEQIERLQAYGFEWDYNLTLEELLDKYHDAGMPKSPLKWWTNTYQPANSSYNVRSCPWLKEFMSLNPPTFKISPRCCDYAKKKVIHRFNRENNVDLDIVGIRRSEGGVRSLKKTCTTYDSTGRAKYRPIFWFKNEDKKCYEDYFQITHSRCYTEYGLSRTGCAGCPFNSHVESTLEAIRPFEPELYTAAMNIFKDSYMYTKAYREFAAEQKGGLK